MTEIGAWPVQRQSGWPVDHGDNLGARGVWGKSTMFEEAAAMPLIVAGRSRMPESGPYGSVRGVSGNGHLYRDQHPPT